MSASKVTQIKPSKYGPDAPLPPRKVLERRASIAQAEAYRAVRMLKMLRLLADSDVVDEGCTEVIDGIGETLDCIADIVRNLANQIDVVTLLSTDVRDMRS